MSFIPHNLGRTDYNFQFRRPGSKKSCDLTEVTTSKRQNWDLNPDPCTAMQNPGPSPYTTLYFKRQTFNPVTSQQRTPGVERVLQLQWLP